MKRPALNILAIAHAVKTMSESKNRKKRR